MELLPRQFPVAVGELSPGLRLMIEILMEALRTLVMVQTAMVEVTTTGMVEVARIVLQVRTVVLMEGV